MPLVYLDVIEISKVNAHYTNFLSRIQNLEIFIEFARSGRKETFNLYPSYSSEQTPCGNANQWGNGLWLGLEQLLKASDL